MTRLCFLLCLLLLTFPVYAQEAPEGFSLQIEEDFDDEDSFEEPSETSSSFGLDIQDDFDDEEEEETAEEGESAFGLEILDNFEEEENNTQQENSNIDGSGLLLDIVEDDFEEEPESTFVQEKHEEKVESFEEDNEEGSEEDQYKVQVSFLHRYRVLGGFNELLGVLPSINHDRIIRDFRFITSYQQTIKIRTSPSMENYVRLSIDFAQNYETHSQRYLDNHFAFREIYVNYSKGDHQLRAGTQIFKLGKIDFDSPIDNLHVRNVVALNTLDPHETKDSLLALKYNWYAAPGTFTIYAAPLQQRTLGMEFTDLKKDAEMVETGEKEDNRSFLRNHFGVQFQWNYGALDTRVGIFRWFDPDNDISFTFAQSQSDVEEAETDAAQDTDDTEDQALTDASNSDVPEDIEQQTLIESGINRSFFNSYTEKENTVSFLTLEMDATFGSYLWKMDTGIFDHKNFYHYQQSKDGVIDFDSVRVPFFAFASSVERYYSHKLFLMGIYSYRHLFNVPKDTHIILYENHSTPKAHARELERHQFTGIARWEMNRHLHAFFIAMRTFPFNGRGVASRFTWTRESYNSEWTLHLLNGYTDPQKMTGDAIEVRQVFIIYARNFF